ncbi:hypothetical protein BC834DRAFT_312426 [Gloeopeniophorella convolvens]|nr:hypothetical protein BC834DRAFT_312426 [Gloeopeniophorella convolvens]
MDPTPRVESCPIANNVAPRKRSMSRKIHWSKLPAIYRTFGSAVLVPSAGSAWFVEVPLSVSLLCRTSLRVGALCLTHLLPSKCMSLQRSPLISLPPRGPEAHITKIPVFPWCQTRRLGVALNRHGFRGREYRLELDHIVCVNFDLLVCILLYLRTSLETFVSVHSCAGLAMPCQTTAMRVVRGSTRLTARVLLCEFVG